MNKQNRKEITILEKGNIYFFYRPVVNKERAEGPSDIQRFYMVLSPEEEKPRLTIIGRKKMPDPASRGNRYWGFVDAVGESEAINVALGGEKYSTKTSGEKHVSEAAPAGEGVYRILRHGDHTHLAYSLEFPKHPGKVQEELNIEQEASYIISIKNPERGSPQGKGLSERQKAGYPKRLQERFRDRAFADADPPQLLDREGAEFVLISASEDIEAELGVELKTYDESEAAADIFKELKLQRSERVEEQLFHGEWA